ncbi:hypothetical protein BLS_006605 [Venturia inaequalis]|uniref:HRDC domain-containing protein n=1 Tax=Venturia inaequalis TaxID=5025 RepID=A0A8H3UPW7_VENIN|nr:hypothetical protein EG327_009124 [Venturia inaequalis]KAE9982068.1 hypothetical protein BLS_006605 [Venturia inaequalis]
MAQQARRKVEQKKRERGRKDRKHQAEYDELNPDSKDLYKSLLELRDNIQGPIRVQFRQWAAVVLFTDLALAVKDKDCFGQTSVWNILGDLLPRQYQYACNDALIPLLLDAALFQQLLDHAYVPHQDVPTETSSYTPPKPRVIDPTQKDQIAAFEKNDPDSLALLDKLTSLRDSILVAQGHDPYGLPNIQFYVANSRSILRLTQHRPSTAEEMRNVKGLGGPTKKEYFFDFLNAVQAHLGLEGTPEPEGWKDQYNKGKAAGKLFLERLKEEGFGFIFCDEKTWAVIWEGGVDGVGC